MGALLGQQLFTHWRGHVLAGLTVALLSFLFFFISTIGPYLGVLTQDAGSDANNADLYVTSASHEPYSLAKSISTFDTVDQVYVSAANTGLALSTGDYAGVTVRQQPPPDFDTADFADGRPPRTINEVSVSTALAQELNVQVGDRITLVLTPEVPVGSSRQMTVSGVHSPAMVTRSRDENPELRVGVALTDLGVAVSYLDDPQDGSVQVLARTARDLATVESAILVIEGTVTTSHVDLSRQITESLNLEIDTWLDQVLAFALLPVILTILTLSSGVAYSMEARQAELRLAHTLGASRCQLLTVLVLEHLAVYVMSAIIGLTVATAMSQGVLALLRSLPGGGAYPIATNPGLGVYALTGVVAAGIGIVCALPALVSTLRTSTFSATTVARSHGIASAISGIFFIGISTALIYVSAIFPEVLDLGFSGFNQPYTLLVLTLIFIAVTAVVFFMDAFETRSASTLARLGVWGAYPLASLRTSSRNQRLPGHGIVTVSAMLTAILCVVSTSLAQYQYSSDSFTPYDLAVQDSGLLHVDLPDSLIDEIDTMPAVSQILPIHRVATEVEFSNGQVNLIDAHAFSPALAADYFGSRHPYSQIAEPGVMIYPRDMAISQGIDDGSTAEINTSHGQVLVTIRLADVAYAAVSEAAFSDPGPTSLIWLRADGASNVDLIDTYSALTSLISGNMQFQPGVAVTLGEDSAHHRDVIGSVLTMRATLLLLTLALVIAVISGVAAMDRRIGQALDERNLQSLGVPVNLRRRNESRAVISHVTVLGVVGILLGIVAAVIVEGARILANSSPAPISVPIAMLFGLLLIIIVLATIANAVRRRIAKGWTW